MIEWKLAKQAISSTAAATHAAAMSGRPFTLYIAANKGSLESRAFGLGLYPFTPFAKKPKP